MLRIMQGDQYSIPLIIRRADGTTVTDADVERVQIVFGPLVKDYPGEVTFSSDRERWFFPVTQEETAQLSAVEHSIQVRIRFCSGNVVGADAGLFRVAKSCSREVL